MNYSSEDYDERDNKILKENEDSKKKHRELEERYKDLVEKKPLSEDLVESLAILQELYSKQNGESDLKKRAHLSSRGFSLEDDFDEEDYDSIKADESDIFRENDVEDIEIDLSFNIEKDDENTDVENDSAGDNSEIKTATTIDESVKFPEDGVFKAFYEDNIAPMLERPDFKEIRDFINNGNDFSDEKYEMLVKAFEEKTGVSYSNVKSIIDNENNKLHDEEANDEEAAEEKDLSFDDFMDGAKKMHAVPVKDKKDEDKMGNLFIGGAISGIVVLIVIFILYSIW